MYVFGGIVEVTKELNDMLVYDFKTQRMALMASRGEAESIQAFKADESVGGRQTLQEGSPVARAKNPAGSPLRKGATINGTSPQRRSQMGMT
jgi:hypothetical protein